MAIGIKHLRAVIQTVDDTTLCFELCFCYRVLKFRLCTLRKVFELTTI